MASAGSTLSLISKRKAEQSLMPPPPTKHIKRPSEVLDEDIYTDALEDIISRDYFPGLREAKAQEEYLAALASKNEDWIRDAGRKLRGSIGAEAVKKIRRESRDRRFDRVKGYIRAEDTPRDTPDVGLDTPASTVADTEPSSLNAAADVLVDTSTISLTSFQGKYTSEDNASFNTVLDTQNDKKRAKHAHLFTPEQRILTQRQITHRETQQKLLHQTSEYERVNGKALISVTTGATNERDAKPESWKVKSPANTLMFMPQTSVDEMGLKTVAEVRQEMSKAGPKGIVFENTRFNGDMARYGGGEDDNDDDTVSIHTSALGRSQAPSLFGGGGETPRVNGYEYVNDEEDEAPVSTEGPSYRDLLAGQAGDVTPNPFQVREKSRREDLHWRLVEREAEKKRARVKQSGGDGKQGNMTPAGQNLLAKLGGKTPVTRERGESMVKKEMWTPVATPRRSRTGVK